MSDPEPMETENWADQNDDDEGWANENDENDADENEDWGNDDDEDPEDDGPIMSPPPIVRQVSAIALKQDSIQEIMMEEVKKLDGILEVGTDAATLLCRLFKWNHQKIEEKYFEGPEKFLKDAGVCMEPVEPKYKPGKKIECLMCFDDVDVKNVFNQECGHQVVCNDCMMDYLTTSVEAGKEAVSLECPAYKCNVVLPRSVFVKFFEKKANLLERYDRFVRSNFVENSKSYGFCPGPNCDMVYKAQPGVSQEIHCVCGSTFCWRCKQEAHFPSSCDVAREWNNKNSSESENIQYILARCKQCPKCHVHIEKNQGCNHMTCRPHAGGCGYEFCWLCKGDWKDHGSATGGYYKCNIYEKNKSEGKVSDEEKSASDAKNELERYTFHFTRYDSHIKSSKHAESQTQSIQDRMFDICKKFGWKLNEARFLEDALAEAVRAWRTLAWTYAIAYYIDGKNKDTENLNTDLFKEWQGILEKFCDGLQKYIDFDQDKLNDNKVRQEIVHYSRTVKKWREDLVGFIQEQISW